jgi:L-ascorbate metabolism protein UlaG (beta-lactamase superfamily)
VQKVKNRNKGCRIIRARDAVINGAHQTFDLDYVRVEAVEAGYNHYHDVRKCAGYVLTFRNGRKVYVAGDTSTTKQMAKMKDMHIDYAFLCTDGLFNMGNKEAAEAAHMIEALHNIPYHNDTSNRGEMFDRDAAEHFDAPNKMIVYPVESILIE